MAAETARGLDCSVVLVELSGGALPFAATFSSAISLPVEQIYYTCSGDDEMAVATTALIGLRRAACFASPMGARACQQKLLGACCKLWLACLSWLHLLFGLLAPWMMWTICLFFLTFPVPTFSLCSPRVHAHSALAAVGV